jgi:hypothetical protein
VTIEDSRGRRDILADYVVARAGYEVSVDRPTCVDPDFRARIRRECTAPALRPSRTACADGLEQPRVSGAGWVAADPDCLRRRHSPCRESGG